MNGQAITDQAYVTERWILTHCCDGSYRDYPRGTVLVQDVNGHWFDFTSWAAAAKFTRVREEEIRQLLDEIREVEHISGPFKGERLEVWQRILTRLIAQLPNLRRGMKL